MQRKYWLPAAAALGLGLFFCFFVYGYGFAIVPLGGTAAVIAAFGLIDRLKGRWPRPMQALRWTLRGLTALVLTAAVATGIWIGLRAAGDDPPDQGYAIVLGAGVNGTTPSLSLYERLVAAEEFMAAHPDTLCILSGGQGDRENISEAQCMYDWLTARGIDPARLRMEDRSTSTAENLRFSLDLIEAETGQRPTQATVISSEYHLARASLLAKDEGLEMVGYPASTSNPLYLCHMFIREIFGVWFTLIR